MDEEGTPGALYQCWLDLCLLPFAVPSVLQYNVVFSVQCSVQQQTTTTNKHLSAVCRWE